MFNKIKIQKIHTWKKFLTYIVALLLRIFAKTIRICPTKEIDNILNSHNNSAVIAFWHKNLFLIWKLNGMLKTKLPMYGLISPSKDGAWLSTLFDIFHINNVRGSSKRGGKFALHILETKLKEGANVAITPDGPRGPAQKLKHGVPLLALQAKVDIILLTMKYSSCWELNTWDKFLIPKPFSKVIVNGIKIPYKDFANMSVPELANILESKLQSLYDSIKF